MKPSARLTATFAILAIAGAVAAGCGNGAQNDYVDKVNTVQNSILSDVTDATSTPASSPKDAAKTGQAIADAFSTGADELESIDPPDEVADLHSQLVDQLRSVSKQLNDAADAFTSGSAQAQIQAANQLQQSATRAQTEINNVIDQINAKFGN